MQLEKAGNALPKADLIETQASQFEWTSQFRRRLKFVRKSGVRTAGPSTREKIMESVSGIFCPTIVSPKFLRTSLASPRYMRKEMQNVVHFF